MDINEKEYPIEYFEKKLYREYINAIFPDFDPENYEMTEKLIDEIEKFHTEFSKCVSRIQFTEEMFKKPFTDTLKAFFTEILKKIIKVKTLKDKQKIIKNFEEFIDKAIDEITSNNNFRTKACLNATRVKWKSHLYGIMVGII